MADQKQSPDGKLRPSLPWEAWQDTCATLHMWSQIIGKIRLAQAPLVNHWWQVPFYITSHGHIVCTQGGESLAGLSKALELGMVNQDEQAILDATAHHLKFIGFQQMYFENSFPPEFGVTPRKELVNAPQEVLAGDAQPAPGQPLGDAEFKAFVKATALEIALLLGLEERS